MNEIIRYLLAFVPNILGSVVYVVFGVIGIALKQLLTRYVNNETKKNLADTAVRYVEQVFKDIHGKDKLLQGINVLQQLLYKHGIQITENEIVILLEAAVQELNEQSAAG